MPRPAARACYARARRAGHSLYIINGTHDEHGIYTKACAREGCCVLLRVEYGEVNLSSGIDNPCPYVGHEVEIY